MRRALGESNENRLVHIFAETRHVVEILELYCARVRRLARSRCRRVRRLLYRAVSRLRAHRGFLASGQGRPGARIRGGRLGVHGGSGPLDARTVAPGRGGVRARRAGASGSTPDRGAGAAEVAPQGIVSQSRVRFYEFQYVSGCHIASGKGVGLAAEIPTGWCARLAKWCDIARVSKLVHGLEAYRNLIVGDAGAGRPSEEGSVFHEGVGVGLVTAYLTA